ncbi:MAG: hypothetical protein ACX939_00365 [Hyphococcus sp.]
MTPILCRLCAAAALAFMATPSSAALNGDPQAIALAEKMIDRLGGPEIWSSTRTLYVEYEGWRGDVSEPVVERAWRDLAEPRQKIVFERRSAEVVWVITPDASWLEHSSRGLIKQTEDEHRNNLDFWNYDFYTILYNLARGDERLTLSLEEPQTVRMTGPGGADWGWFEIDQTGQPIRWGAPDGDDALEYVYGPVKAFGNINFPAWGTASNGFWRFDYTDVDVSRHPLDIDLTPPDS